MQLLLATNNDHKRGEFAAIFADHEVLTPKDLGLELDVEESGPTFLANALLKAEHLRALLASNDRTVAYRNATVIADDSGLCVDALGGGPGVYSARFGSPDGGKTELDSGARNQLLLGAMEGVADRTAHFVCCMVALLPGDRLVIAQESWHGRIADSPSAGTGGFGYDPVFYVPELERTAAELPAAEKNAQSHRGRASTVLHAGLNEAMRLPGPQAAAT
jgi:XTP/dITP diphosphohydrolase